MKINIRWKDMSKIESLEILLNEKATRIFEFKFAEGDIKAEFTYHESNKNYELKLSVGIHKKGIIEANAHSINKEEVVTICVNKIIDQLRKHKTKINQNKH